MSTDADTGLSVGLQLFAGIGDKMDREYQWRLKHTDIVSQVPTVASLPGNGTVDNGAPQMAPPRGWCWSIRWLSVTGFSAGQVSILINALEPFMPFINPPSVTVPGFYSFNRGGFLLQPGDRYTVTATGITGNVLVAGRADMFPTDYLRSYLD